MDPEQTIAEIQKILSKFGVTAMMTDYDGPNVSAVSFQMVHKGKKIAYRMPCNWRAVRAAFDEQRITQGKLKHKDRSLDNQAIRTAWRVVKVWLEAQIALVEINMATIPQIFLPYTIMSSGETLSDRMERDPSFLLGDGK